MYITHMRGQTLETPFNMMQSSSVLQLKSYYSYNEMMNNNERLVKLDDQLWYFTYIRMDKQLTLTQHIVCMSNPCFIPTFNLNVIFLSLALPFPFTFTQLIGTWKLSSFWIVPHYSILFPHKLIISETVGLSCSILMLIHLWTALKWITVIVSLVRILRFMTWAHWVTSL